MKMGTRVALFCILVLACQNIMPSEAQNTPQDFLAAHNAARSEVGVGPLRWDTALEAYAAKYANVRSGDCALIHSQGPYGENIYYGFGEGYDDAAGAMRYWVNEKNYYDYASNTCAAGKECLHYTQIVWRKTEAVGCARIACAANGNYFITCNYSPLGNIEGEKPY